jgi:hypothetical protein
MYKYRDAAEFACRRLQDKEDEEHQKLWNVTKPKGKFKVHAFFLVHEDMFRELINLSLSQLVYHYLNKC